MTWVVIAYTKHGQNRPCLINATDPKQTVSLLPPGQQTSRYAAFCADQNIFAKCQETPTIIDLCVSDTLTWSGSVIALSNSATSGFSNV